MLLSTQYPIAKVETSCTRSVKKLTGSHKFEIMGYSLEKDIDKEEFLESTIFSVGGHDWFIRYYPSGTTEAEEGYASIFLYLRSSSAECVKAEVCFGILHQCGSALPIIQTKVNNFKEIDDNWGFFSFAKRAKLESYVKDDCLILTCTITVFKVFPVEPTESIVIPPGNLQSQLGHLLETGNGADVTFKVNGVKFSAHRCILAARSSVFSAQFFGPMKEKPDTIIKIEEMEAPVFKCMLHFIYCDSVPEFLETKDGGKEEQGTHLEVQQLLIAADRYNLERLKIICQKMLYDTVDKSNVVSLLSLAERHSCIHLKKGCLQYLVSTDMLGEVIEAEEFQQVVKNDPLILKELLGK